MKLNQELLEKIKKSDSRLLAVTKYHDTETTIEITSYLEENYPEIIEWFWENRLESLKEKNLDREKVHFIWNIQSKQIKEIVKYASVIHSVDDIKHLKKIEDICWKQWNWVEVFLQINLDDSKPGWVKIEKIPEFLDLIWEMENVSLVWFSAIWKSDFTIDEKKQEFETLIKLRNKYISNWFVSAGTSLDYEIALEMWVDIVRIWKTLYE